MARAAGYAVSRGAEIDPQPSDAALVVASHGDEEERALARALEAGVGYVGLVASPRRGAAVLASLDVDDALRALVHTPAGLDIGAATVEETAIAVLAEITAGRAGRPGVSLRDSGGPIRRDRGAADALVARGA